VIEGIRPSPHATLQRRLVPLKAVRGRARDTAAAELREAVGDQSGGMAADCRKSTWRRRGPTRRGAAICCRFL